MSTSAYAHRLTCKHCGQQHGTQQWPANGDLTPLYFQREPGKYTLTVTCPHCQKDWHVVWDSDPGQIEPLEGVARHETLGEAMARSGGSMVDVLRSWTDPARVPINAAPAPVSTAPKCDICVTIQNDPLNWRTISHDDLKASVLLIRKAVQIKFPQLKDEDVKQELRDAWIVDVERDVGRSDWLLCPACSLLAGDFEGRQCEIARQDARTSAAAVANALKVAENTAAAAAKAATEAQKEADKVRSQYEKKRQQVKPHGKQAAAGNASERPYLAAQLCSDATQAAGKATTIAAQVNRVADEARKAAVACCEIGRSTVEGELAKWLATGDPATRKKAQELAKRVVQAATQAAELTEKCVDAAQQAAVATVQLNLAIAYGLADNTETYRLLDTDAAEPPVSEPPKTAFDWAVIGLAIGMGMCCLGFLAGLRNPVLAVLFLVAAIGCGGVIAWLKFLSPWGQRDARLKQAHVAQQLPALLEARIHRRLLESESRLSKEMRSAVKQVTVLTGQGSAAVPELIKLLKFESRSADEQAYVRWRAAQAIRMSGLDIPLKPSKLFQADAYLKTKTMVWRDEASQELAAAVRAACKVATNSKTPRKKTGNSE